MLVLFPGCLTKIQASDELWSEVILSDFQPDPTQCLIDVPVLPKPVTSSAAWMCRMFMLVYNVWIFCNLVMWMMSMAGDHCRRCMFRFLLFEFKHEIYVYTACMSSECKHLGWVYAWMVNAGVDGECMHELWRNAWTVNACTSDEVIFDVIVIQLVRILGIEILSNYSENCLKLLCINFFPCSNFFHTFC